MSLATDTTYRNPFKSKRYTLQRLRRSYIVVICKNKSYITFVIDPLLMMAKSWAESPKDIYIWTIHKSIPAEYDKSNTAIRADPEENI